MIVLKFTTIFFLMYLAFMVTLRNSPKEPVGGPYYYGDPPPGAFALPQPRFKLNFWQAWHSDHYCEIYFDSRSLPFMIKHMNKQHHEEWRMELLYTKEGRLRRRTYLSGGMVLRVDETPDSSATPTPDPWTGTGNQ